MMKSERNIQTSSHHPFTPHLNPLPRGERRNLSLWALVTFCFCSLTQPAEASVPTQKQPMQIAKNRLASLEERKEAIDQLKFVQDPEILPKLIEIIRDPKEPVPLRGHVVEALILLTDKQVSSELMKLVKDSALAPEIRKMALYGLWKKDPEQVKADLMKLAQDPQGTVELRAAALNYLKESKGNWPHGFWIGFLTQKANPPAVRISALNAMEELNLLIQHKTRLSQLLQDPREAVELRKSIVLAMSRSLPPAFSERELVSIVSRPENSLEMRRFALDNLASSRNKAVISEVEQILANESNPSLLNEFEVLTSSQNPKTN